MSVPCELPVALEYLAGPLPTSFCHCPSFPSWTLFPDLKAGVKSQFYQDFPSGPVVKNLPSNAGDTGSISIRGTKIPHAKGLLNPQATAREKPPCHHREPTCAATKTQHSQINKIFFKNQFYHKKNKEGWSTLYFFLPCLKFPFFF